MGRAARRWNRFLKESEALAREFLEENPDPQPSTKTLKLIYEHVSKRYPSAGDCETLAKMVWRVLFPGRDLPQEAYPQSLF